MKKDKLLLFIAVLLIFGSVVMKFLYVVISIFVLNFGVVPSYFTANADFQTNDLTNVEAAEILDQYLGYLVRTSNIISGTQVIQRSRNNDTNNRPTQKAYIIKYVSFLQQKEREKRELSLCMRHHHTINIHINENGYVKTNHEMQKNYQLKKDECDIDGHWVLSGLEVDPSYAEGLIAASQRWFKYRDEHSFTDLYDPEVGDCYNEANFENNSLICAATHDEIDGIKHSDLYFIGTEKMEFRDDWWFILLYRPKSGEIVKIFAELDYETEKYEVKRAIVPLPIKSIEK